MSKWNEGYAAGHRAAWERRDATDHIIAFGAIRRAVEIARQADKERAGHVFFQDWESEIVAVEVAETVRRAIRAAIGSPKV